MASSAAVMWALVAALVKTMTDTLTEFGVGGMLLHWPVYALPPGSARLTLDAVRLTVGSAAFAVMCGSVVALTRTAPATMSSHGDPESSSSASATTKTS